MPAATCPRCRTPQPVPLPAHCSACGQAFQPPVTIPAGLPAAHPRTPAVGSYRGPRLSGQMPDGRMQDFPLEAKATLGRHPANTVRLPDREVSKEHATIERAGTVFLIKDLDSSNGTFVNGRRVQELKLRDGDEITMGNSRLIFHAGDPPQQAASTGGVTVLATAQSMPAFLAQIAQTQQNEFRPAEQISDVGELKQDYEKLRIAHEFQRQVGLVRNVEKLGERILQVAFQLLPADNGVLFLVDPASGQLRPQSKLHRTNKDQEVILSETLLKRVTETRQGVLTADAILDHRFSASESIVAQGIRSAMAVPLLTNTDGAGDPEMRGLLFIDTRSRTNAFSEKDLKILSGIAGQAAIALENADLARKIETEAVTRAELSRFLSPAVAEMVVKGQVELLRLGRLAEVNVLFADIRGFTTISENEDPQETVAMLNDFFTAMSAVVFQHEGNLDKFIGDCVMAVWGPPSPHPDDPARVLRAALQMQQEVHLLNARRVAAGDKEIEVGIGVNTGQAVVGYMGSPERHEFTAIGDSVNTASRLCGLAKGGEILASEATVKQAGAEFLTEALPLAQVKGKERGVQTYRVVGLDSEAEPTLTR